ncbi:MAG: thioredoxin [Deltaproteobacteria bacterium]|nr:thioredoxin [Deltaproteobacteria bacterium]
MPKPLTVSQDNFDSAVLQASQPVLVDFWAAWCGPCRTIGPMIEKLADEFDGRATVGKLNVDEHPALAQRFNVRNIPTLLFFKDGEVVDSLVGVPRSSTVLSEKLAALIG